jgi:hypothetical protein
MTNPKDGGKSDSITPSTALLNQEVGISPGYRMLTPHEQDLLRKSKKELGERIRMRFLAEVLRSPEDP